MSRRDRQARKDASSLFFCFFAFVLAFLAGVSMGNWWMGFGFAAIVACLAAAVMMAGADVGEE
jgi:peptidoglycan/LPS O-acetylase OafA/YrhL